MRGGGVAGTAAAAYVETGVIGDKASWETEEYKKDWGLGAMNASTAYSLGFYGQDTLVAVMDSGALLSHPDLNSDRITGDHVTGEYGSSGNRYPQSIITTIPGETAEGQPYEKGETFEVTGDWMEGVNDSHGTHVTGTVGANRDGSEFHGVAWGANVIVGNTGATDSNNYGPFQDYQYFYTNWKSLADKLVAANGADRGGVINNSWGTNIRVGIIQQLQEVVNEQTGVVSKRWVQIGGIPTVEEIEAILKEHPNDDPEEVGSYRVSFSGHIPTNSIAQAEYEYFYHNLKSGEGQSFVDAAWDAVKGTNVVQVFTTGNRDSANPFYRPLYPYFNPEAEGNWIAVAGLGKASDYTDDNPKYKLMDTWNEAGLGKYWTVAAPGSGIYGSKVDTTTGEALWGNSSGTSMSAPHVTGAMTVLMSRYQSMSAVQVRDVLFTTASHKNPDGTNMEGWDNADGSTPLEGEVSDRMGWGVPDLDKGMYGLGQLLGKFEYTMNNSALDVWSNDISEVALKQREKEELKWMEDTKNGTDLSGDYELGADFVVGDGDLDFTNHIISEEDAEKWRAEYYAKRAEAIQYKIDNDLYKGSLVKAGSGTLVMTGNNTYTGGTVVNEGALFGFTESFGTGTVEVNGGMFGIINSYNDEFTQKGLLTSLVGVAREDVQKATIVVNEGGTYVIAAGQDVTVQSLTFNEGSKVTVGSLTNGVFEAAFAGETQTGTVTAVDGITGIEDAIVVPDYALVNTSLVFDKETNTIQTTVSKNESVTFASYAKNSNGRSVARALEAGLALAGVPLAMDETGEASVQAAFPTDAVKFTKEQLSNTISSLANDLHVTANAMSLMNGMQLARTIKDQAVGIDGAARTAQIDDGRARMWVAGTANWGKFDRAGSSKMDVDFYAGLVGVEADFNPNNKVGAFFGAGKSKFKTGSDGKIDSNDIHFGIYGQSQIDPVRLTYGFAYTQQDRDSSQSLVYGDTATYSGKSYNAKVAQIYGEAAYTGLNVGTVNIEPYFGLAWMHVSADGFSQDYAGTQIKTDFKNQNVAVTNLGARAKVPFQLGSAKLKAVADVNWTQFMGDTRGKSTLDLGTGMKAHLQSEKLSAVAAVGVGLEANLGKNTTLGVSYNGAFGSKVHSNGVAAKLKIAF